MNKSWLGRAGLTGVAAAAVVVIAAAPASAHVTVSAPDAARGGSAVLEFRVPNESVTNSPTVELAVQIPGVTAIDTEAVPGWKAVTHKDGNVTTVTWTADSGGGIGPGQFGEFSVLANGLPDMDKLTMPAVQTYADGEVIKWDQSASDKGEPEYPAPTLALAAEQSGGAENHGDIPAMSTSGGASSDDTARWLGVIGIVLGALGLLIGGGAVMRRK
ncbi:YcnI family protein [Nocardia sp. CA-129566]|uniref:YcnI family protein n=1 Tax=Nocardia sp. CA-129566 TaxID=3239976 RepID=UPI003D99F277